MLRKAMALKILAHNIRKGDNFVHSFCFSQIPDFQIYSRATRIFAPPHLLSDCKKLLDLLFVNVLLILTRVPHQKIASLTCYR